MPSFLANLYHIEAKAAIFNNDSSLALHLHTKAADIGHPESAYYVGMHSNYTQTQIKYFTLASSLNHKLATFHLAVIYEKGRPGVAVDPGKAFQLYNQCVTLGHWQAVEYLAGCYERGFGCEKDAAKALKTFEDRQQVLQPWVLYTLGRYYRDGIGTPGSVKNMGKAVGCFQKAAAVGNPFAHLALAEWYESSGKQQDLAAFHYGAAVNVFMQLANKKDEGSSSSLLRLGQLYSSGKGLVKDDVKAFEFYQAAANAGDKIGYFAVGDCYYEGRGCVKDDSLAIQNFKLSADQGYAKAKYMLGNMYRRGEGISQDYSKAMIYYQEAAEKEPKAISSIVSMYLNGEGVEKSQEKADEWLLKLE
ncbi:UNVERIFIED_CONTAM: hypothetical protein HDU68_005975 [Siphonaria sp. JEL0065]|nr:hypothetical protein HDU68_005975 [Siphonaria sp. JEL0065]